MISDAAKLKKEFDRYKIFIFDLDGTIYRGKTLIDGADEVIQYLKKIGKQIIYLTNNATRTRESVVEKLKSMNITCNIDEVISSAYIAMHMLHDDFNIKTIFVIGTNELVQEAINEGLDPLNNKIPDNILFADFLDPSIRSDAVICALDVGMTYAKIRTGMELVNRGAEFYATNSDKTFPESNQIWPGGGMVVAALEASVGRPPKIIFGKPNAYGINLILQLFNQKDPNITYEFKDMLIIGDRLETDILQANNANVDSVLVETGIHKREDIPKNSKNNEDKKLIPTFILKQLKDLFILDEGVY